MALETTHTFELETGDLSFEGEIEFPSGTYTEDQPEELPARLDVDFKEIIARLKNFYDTYGSLVKFEVKLKE